MSDGKKRRRRRVHRLTRKVIAFMRENEEEYTIQLHLLRGNYKLQRRFGMHTHNIVGCVLWDELLIIADPRYDVIATIIHECLHVLYPDAKEKSIKKMERLCVRHLTRRQAETILYYTVRMMRVTP